MYSNFNGDRWGTQGAFLLLSLSFGKAEFFHHRESCTYFDGFDLLCDWVRKKKKIYIYIYIIQFIFTTIYQISLYFLTLFMNPLYYFN